MNENNTTKTPLTDSNCWSENGYKNGEVVLARFARQLERRCAELERQLTALHHALGVFNGGHDRALLRAQHAIADSELLEWAEGKELHLDYNRGEVSLEYWTANEDGTLGCREFHGPDLRDVLRQAMEWEEREHG